MGAMSSVSDLTRDVFDAQLAALDLTPREFAAQTGIDATTIYRWRRETAFPLWVPLLLKTWRLNRYLMKRGKK
jgi:hypothetical protein